jgi:S-adenosylmethionine:tRNA ribosyltransferase-isomerase
MLVVSRDKQSFLDDSFENIHSYVGPGDCLVLNNTRVFPARLFGHRNTMAGAGVEILLIHSTGDDGKSWRALVRPGKRVKNGDRILLTPSAEAEVLSSNDFGERILRFHSEIPIAELFERIGHVPLPPYIDRTPDIRDKDRYQTVFALRSGSAAAPTAGLHFTPEILTKCQAAGARIAHVTLHVGLGTFAPLRTNRLADIQLHAERFTITSENADQLRGAQRLLCVGTTSVRTVESCLRSGPIRAMEDETNLFIAPGFDFRGTGAMLTNFHLPQSSLLILVCSFGGEELILRAYRHAVAERYRFFSYGDCMLIR